MDFNKENDKENDSVAEDRLKPPSAPLKKKKRDWRTAKTCERVEEGEGKKKRRRLLYIRYNLSSAKRKDSE